MLLLIATWLPLVNAQSPLESIALPRVIVADDSFVYSPSPATGSATWSAEFITRDMLVGESAERPGSFYVDRDIPAELRASVRDYAGSGYDMGHLAPDADTPDSQAKIRRARLSNVAPQSPGLNRGWWRKLEEHVRELAKEHGAAFVVTAPVYARQGRPQVVGSLVAPSHFIKCVLVLDVDETRLNGGRIVPAGFEAVAKPHAMHAWIVPNQTPPTSATLETYSRTVDACEELLQLDLFPWLNNQTENRMEAGK